MFHEARINRINGGFFAVVNEQNGMTGLQILHRVGSHGAAHDSVEHAPQCHPETRKTMVSDMISWIEDPSRSSKVLWFNGPAGAGKTAIAQTLCKLCAAKQWLAASFFFSRLAFARNDATRLFSTIAYQLAIAIPAFAKIIEEVVSLDPSIVTKELEIQLQELIVRPLQEVSALPIHPVVIIIDGLDECKGEGMQCYILRLLGSVFQHPLVGGLSHICFIVTSRPEPWIRNEFDVEPLSQITRQIFLGQTAEANDDIRTFFRAGFTEIHESSRHHLTMANVETPWPSYRVLDDLVEKASGQFIYPATVLKFVDEPNYRPTDRLDIITSIPVVAFSASNPKPFAALDRLYSQILSTSCDKQRTLDILSVLLAMQESLMTNQDDFKNRLPTWTSQDAEWLQFSRSFRLESLRIAEKLLGLQPGDGHLALRMIHSLIYVPGRALISDVPDYDLSILDDIENSSCIEDEIWFHHKSFIDYLLDPSRSLGYYVDMPQMHMRLALACLGMMQTFSLQPASRIACVTWGYAIFFWDDHFIGSGPPQRQLLRALQSFDVIGTYLDTLGPQRMQERCWNTIERVAIPARLTTLGKVAQKLGPKKKITERIGPNPADIEIASKFLIHLGAGFGFTESYYAMILDNVISWMEKYPNPPPELRQYKILVNVLSYYSNFSPDNPAPPQSDKYFTRKMHRSRSGMLFNRVNIWTLLNRRK